MKIPNFATNNINIWFFTQQTQPDLGKSNLLISIVLLTAQQIIQVSFQTFLTAFMLGYNKISLIPVSQSKCFSSPSPIYHKIILNPRQSTYFSSLNTIYHKIHPSPVMQFKHFSSLSPTYHKVNPIPERQAKIFQVQVQ